MTMFTEDEACALLALALAAAARESEPAQRRVQLGAVVKLAAQIGAAAERAAAELTQPSLPVAPAKKRGRPPGARTRRKPEQTALPVTTTPAPAASPEGGAA